MKFMNFLILLCALVVFTSANPIDEWDDYDYDSLEDLEGDSSQVLAKLPALNTPPPPPMKPVMGIMEKIKSIFLIGLQTVKEIIEPIPAYF